MSYSLENYCEQLAVALLQASPSVVGIVPADQIVRESEDLDASKDRVACSALPREVETPGRAQYITKVWRVPVAVKIFAVSLTAVQISALTAAIQVAMNANPGAAAMSIINAASIREMDDTDEGDFTTEDNARKRSKTFNFLSEATSL